MNFIVADLSGHFYNGNVCYDLYNGYVSHGLKLTIPAGMIPLADDIITTSFIYHKLT